MKFLYFTKFLKGWSCEEVGRAALELGVSGLDLAVRSGQCVNPENVSEALPTAVKRWSAEGLDLPLVTLEASWTDPRLPALREVYRAAGESGVPYIKLGYWSWRREDDYQARLDDIRRDLEEFERLGRDCGVTTLLHTHSGGNYGSNASGVMRLLQGFSPEHLGAYIDPAHLSLAGEMLPMALSIVKPYLRMAAAKNARYVLCDAGARHRVEWCLLTDGLVDWAEALRELTAAGFDGPVSIHGEYSATEEAQGVLELARVDARYLLQIEGRPS